MRNWLEWAFNTGYHYGWTQPWSVGVTEILPKMPHWHKLNNSYLAISPELKGCLELPQPRRCFPRACRVCVTSQHLTFKCLLSSGAKRINGHCFKLLRVRHIITAASGNSRTRLYREFLSSKEMVVTGDGIWKISTDNSSNAPCGANSVCIWFWYYCKIFLFMQTDVQVFLISVFSIPKGFCLHTTLTHIFSFAI